VLSDIFAIRMFLFDLYFTCTSTFDVLTGEDLFRSSVVGM
jgi:hypothetical protein